VLAALAIGAARTTAHRTPPVAPPASRPSALVRVVASPSIPAHAPTTHAHPTTSTRGPTTTTTTAPHRVPVSAPPNPTTTTSSQPDPTETREACLALAAANHYAAVAANAAWLQAQLRGLTAHHLLNSPLHQAIAVEEQQTLDVIDAQYTIDQSNCYLDRTLPTP
jgi:hypothetical protein